MYVLSKVKNTHAAKLQFSNNRSVYFAVIDDFEATKTKVGSSYREATSNLKKYREENPGECVNIRWVN